MHTSRTRRTTLIVALGLLLGLLTPIAASAQIDLESDPGSPVRLSNLALASRLFDAVFNDGDVAAAERLVADDAVIHTPYGAFTGPDGLQDYLDIIRRAYPDARFTVASIDVRGDEVTVQWVMVASRYQIGPNEPVIDVSARMSGETTITVADGQITAMTQASDTAVVRAPVEVTVSDSGLRWP